MSEFRKLRKQLHLRWPLILMTGSIALISIIQLVFQRSQPRITHTFGDSTQNVDVLWLTQDILTFITSNDTDIVFAIPLAQDKLVAYDIRKGSILWKANFPVDQSGVSGLLANQNTVFVVSTLSVDAYEIPTGRLEWSTKLGEGHVRIIPQLDLGILRVYYGNTIYEIDSATGKMLSTIPKATTVWMFEDIILQVSPANQLSGLERQTGKTLWGKKRMFYIDEGLEPQIIGKDILLVGFVKGICALNLLTGEYSWCHPEIDISKIAIDYQSRRGFAMRDDLVLLTIDLQNGNVLGKTSFLSSKPIDEQIGSVSSVIFSDGVVVVSFSDSGQTFGLEFTDNP